MGTVYQEKSAAIYAIEIISGKWCLPIMLELSIHESMRYNELKHQLEGISNIMLTRALQDLERNGLIQRKELAQLPRYVEYSLTAGGQQLLGTLDRINEWGKIHYKAVPSLKRKEESNEADEK